MKKKHLLLLFAIVAVSLAACEKDDDHDHDDHDDHDPHCNGKLKNLIKITTINLIVFILY